MSKPNPKLKPKSIAGLVVLAGLVLAPTEAFAQRASAFAELVAGASAPVADADHTALIDPSAKLGVRLGYLRPRPGERFTLAFELAVDWSPLADSFEDAGGTTTSFQRVRVLGGTRLLWRPRADVTAFGRALVGADLFSVDQVGSLGGLRFDDTTAHMGVALELGGGAALHLGELSVGVQLAVPVAFQRGEQLDGNIDVSFTAISVDLLLAAAYRLP